MAKKRKVKAKKDVEPEIEDAEVEAEDADPFAGTPAPETEPQAGKPSGGFFQSLGNGLKAAGQTAERYARMGASVAELEKLRIELKVAYGRLGACIIKCWDAAPDIGVAANDPAVKDPVKVVKDLRRRIREIEIKIKTLQSK